MLTNKKKYVCVALILIGMLSSLFFTKNYVSAATTTQQSCSLVFRSSDTIAPDKKGSSGTPDNNSPLHEGYFPSSGTKTLLEGLPNTSIGRSTNYLLILSTLVFAIMIVIKKWLKTKLYLVGDKNDEN